MAYHIKINTVRRAYPSFQPDYGFLKIQIMEAILADGRFKITGTKDSTQYKAGLKEGSCKEGYGFILGRVRLAKSKLFCGSHPGECPVIPGVKKEPLKKNTFLEADDWIALHNLINDVLDKYNVDADIWTQAQGNLYVRKGLKRRVRWIGNN